jgi:hypothetical protein
VLCHRCQVRLLREETKRLRADKESLDLRCKEVESALVCLKDSVYRESGGRREAEHRLQVQWAGAECIGM